MEEKTALFTISALLLFAVSTARISFDPVVGLNDNVFKSSPESVAVADSNVVEKPLSEFDGTTTDDRLPESENTQTFDVSTVDPTQPLNFVRLHPIKRHFSTRIPLRFVRRHPCRKFQKTFMIPRTKISYGNDVILSDKTDSFDPRAFGDQVQTKWLDFKHDYGHRRHHSHRHVNGDEFVFGQEKVNSLSRFRKEKKKEHEGGFMKRIRKFLKHTFE